MGSHTGTHLDAPLHTVPGGAAVDELPLEQLAGPARIVGPACVSAGGDLADLTVIRWQDVAPGLDGLMPGTIVLFSTGWSRYFNTPRYLRHPSFHPEIAERLVAAGVRLVGVDTLNPDPTPLPGSSGIPQLRFHDVFLGAGGGIVENLTNLGAVTWPDPLFSALPLRLSGVDGSPVRAAAFSSDEPTDSWTHGRFVTGAGSRRPAAADGPRAPPRSRLPHRRAGPRD
nr:cyclase family protein [Arthrobacter jiangjiafuii]